MNTKENYQHGYAMVNGISLYYEIHGSGEPLILLPGGFMTVEAMGEIVPKLATTRQVIGVELQGHGHTADIERHLRFEFMADDIAALIRHLGLEYADIFGFSLGGGVGLQTAIRHPEVVRKIVLASTAFKKDGWYPEVLAGMASISVEGFATTPLPETYLKTSPRPEAWPGFVAKMRQLLSDEYDWTASIAALKNAVLIIVGDADSIRLPHAMEFFTLLGGGKGDGDMQGPPASRLAILPSTTHVGWAPPFHGMMNRSELLLPIIKEFLDPISQ